MTTLTTLVRSVEALLPPGGALSQLLQRDRLLAELTISVGYALAGEPELVGPDLAAMLERGAQEYVAMVAQPC